MGCSPLRAGLVALALVSALGAAEAKDKKGDTLPTLGEVESSPREVARIRQFLAADTNLTKMKLPRLQQRLHRAEAFRAVHGLPPDLDKALEQEIARIAQEISRRQQGAAAPAGKLVAQTQPQPEPQLEDPPLPPYDPQKAEQPAPETPAGSAAAAAFLQAVRPVDQLNAAELQQQLRRAMDLLQARDLSPEQNRALHDVVRDTQAALRKG